MVELVDGTDLTATLTITEEDDFGTTSHDSVLEIEPDSSIVLEHGTVTETERETWEFVCTKREPKLGHQLVGCQRQIHAPGKNFICPDACRDSKGRVYASRIPTDSNEHFFKKTSTLCKAATFAGITTNEPFDAIETKVFRL